MNFKIKGKAIRDMYHGQWLEDNSGDGPFLMEYNEDGNYTFYKKDMSVYESNVHYTLIGDGIAKQFYFIVENPNK